MATFSKTGKPICCRCRKLATSRYAGQSHSGGVVETLYVYHCKDHAHQDDEPLPDAAPASQVRRGDLVKVGQYNIVGFVKRVACDGSWADVDWHDGVKRMPTGALKVQHTIPMGNGIEITDMDRQRELEGDQAEEDDETLADVFGPVQQDEEAIQVEPLAHPCPFCPIIFPEELGQWRSVEDTEYGEPATVGIVRSCEPCARYAWYAENEDALIATLKAKHCQMHDPVDCQCPSCNGDGEVKCQACGVYFLADGEGHYQAGEYAYCDECYYAGPAESEPEREEPKMYRSLEEAQAALDRGETVRIEMTASEINSALVQLAQDIQDREQLANWQAQQGLAAPESPEGVDHDQ